MIPIAQSYGLSMTVMLEVARPTAASQADDLARFLDEFGHSPALLTWQGRPVIFAYRVAVAGLTATEWDEAMKPCRERGAYILGDPTHLPVSPGADAHWDGYFRYGFPDSARERGGDEFRSYLQAFYEQERRFQAPGMPVMLVVMPGFDKELLRPNGLRNLRYDGETYRACWDVALSFKPNWVVINTFNEWYESSQIEPSDEHGITALVDTAHYAEIFHKQRPIY